MESIKFGLRDNRGGEQGSATGLLQEEVLYGNIINM